MKKYTAFLLIMAFFAVLLCGISGFTLKKNEAIIGEKDMIAQLLSNEYTSSENYTILKSNIGLTDPWNIGVDKQAFDNMIMYNSINGQDEYIIDSELYGVNGIDMYDDSVGVANAIARAKEYKLQNRDKTVRILLPSGDLDFIQGKNPSNCNYAIDLSECEDIILQGGNTNLYIYGDMGAILLSNSKNVLIKDVNIDWGRVPFSIGKIEYRADDLMSVKIKINSGYPVDETTKIQGYLEYDQFTYLPRENGNDIYPSGIATYHYLGNQTIEVNFVNPVKKMPLSTLVVLRHKIYENDAIFAERSKNVYFESINIYSAPGMGIRAYTCENMYFNRFSTKLKPNTDRLMSVTADSIHTIDCKGALKVTNSLFENRGDDALNTHGMYLKIGKKLSKNQIYAYNPRGYNFAPDIGDRIEISRRNNLSVVQTAIVKKVDMAANGDGFNITFMQNIDDSVEASMSLNDGDVICNPSRSTELYFVNNIVRNSRCRGILIQTRKATVVNNTFANMSDCAILLTSDTGVWYESLPSGNVIIRNNKIIGNNRSLTGSQGEISAICFGADNEIGATGLQKNVEISNNFIANGRKAGIFLNSMSNIRINNNLIHNVGSQSQITMLDTALGFTNVSEVEIIGNVINPNSGATFKPIYIGSDTETDSFRVVNNRGLSMSDIVPEIASAINIVKTNAVIDLSDFSLSDWQNVGTSLPMVGKSDVDQELVSPSETDFNNWLKATWKDDGLYFAYSVIDDELLFNDTNQYWYGDGVEAFLSVNTTSQSSMASLKLTEPSCLQLFLSPSAIGCLVSDVRSSEEVLSNKDLIIMKCWLKADGIGYEGEVYIPFAAIPRLENAVFDGAEISFCVNFFDVDSIGKQISISNADAPVENNKFVPGRMPKIKFFNGGEDL